MEKEKLTFEVGQTYLTRGGDRVVIKEIGEDEVYGEIVGGHPGFRYSWIKENGRYFLRKEDDIDLVAYENDVKEFEPSLAEFMDKLEDVFGERVMQGFYKLSAFDYYKEGDKTRADWYEGIVNEMED